MDIQYKEYPNTLAVRLCGEIDHCASAELRTQMEIELQVSGKRNIVFDLSRLELMDSSGIGLMIGRYKRLHASGGRAAIAGARGNIARMIKLSGIARLIPLYESVSDAVNELERRKA